MELDVLLVDDEVEFVEAFAERLRLRGFVPHVAYNGEQALQKVKEGVARILVLDLKMPGIDGLEVLKRIKKEQPDVQVIILSGHGSERDEDVARNLGACEYLRKPADICSILECLKRAQDNLKNS